jgi:hypothetical protein
MQVDDVVVDGLDQKKTLPKKQLPRITIPRQCAREVKVVQDNAA